jgi:hypothetical protein
MAIERESERERVRERVCVCVCVKERERERERERNGCVGWKHMGKRIRHMKSDSVCVHEREREGEKEGEKEKEKREREGKGHLNGLSCEGLLGWSACWRTGHSHSIGSKCKILLISLSLSIFLLPIVFILNFIDFESFH